jgi:fluoride exporter
MLVGGVLGVYLRNLLEGQADAEQSTRGWWLPIAISVIGGFVLGALTGAALSGAEDEGPSAALGLALSAALTTYCLFSGAATALIKHGPDRPTLIRAGINAVLGFAAATGGVVLGITLAT